MAAHGCQTQMHVVCRLAPEVAGATHLKDLDVSPRAIAGRWLAGYGHTHRGVRVGNREGQAMRSISIACDDGTQQTGTSSRLRSHTTQR